jgi:hypothetical protein
VAEEGSNGENRGVSQEGSDVIQNGPNPGGINGVEHDFTREGTSLKMFSYVAALARHWTDMKIKVPSHNDRLENALVRCAKTRIQSREFRKLGRITMSSQRKESTLFRIHMISKKKKNQQARSAYLGFTVPSLVKTSSKNLI